MPILPRWVVSTGKLLALNALIAFLLVVMMAPFTRHSFATVFEHYFAVNLVISNCVGLLCGAVLPLTAPLTPDKPAWVAIGSITVQLLAISAAGCWLATEVVRAWWGIRLDLWEIYRVGAIVALLVGGAAVVFETHRARIEAANLEIKHRQLEQERALQLASAAKLQSIESRIQPHFLFNALNSISSLIREDPERAERLVGQLSSLLRGSLDTHRESLIPLEREIGLVRDYLEIQKARFETRLRFAIHIEESALSAFTPPFSIQTLVENSVKFAVAPRREGGDVTVTARMDSGRLLVEVTDDGAGFDTGAIEPGHGLDNLSSRLSSLFGEGANLTVQRGEDGKGSVTGFTIPQERRGPPGRGAKAGGTLPDSDGDRLRSARVP